MYTEENYERYVDMYYLKSKEKKKEMYKLVHKGGNRD